MSRYLVEVMPKWCQDSHRAAHNWGRYPANGAERVEIEADSEAEALSEVATCEYDHVVRCLDGAS